MISEKIEEVRCRIAASARSAGRDPAEIRLICVTKGVPIERIREAIFAGVREIGENRVQEAQEKHSEIGAWHVPDTDLTWHLIGHLQRNKAKLAVQLFDVIHSVDSVKLVEELTLRQAQRERPLEVLLQVNVSGEVSKGGCRPEQAEELAEMILKAKHLRWSGLMTMAPYSENPEDSRHFFRQLREIRDQFEKRFRDCFVGPSGPPRNDRRRRLELSMGMSGDFEVAVQEGATMVRIGSAIFGE